MTTREMIEVMEAYERGEKLEYKIKAFTIFMDVENEPLWDWTAIDYRIKPKEKKIITLYEYMVFIEPYTNKWSLLTTLYKDDNGIEKEWIGYKFQKTGREFQVEEN
jgi:hypothetical protein